MNQTFQIWHYKLEIPTLAGKEPVENFLVIAKAFKLRLTGVNQLPGLRIATDTVANVTNIFALATKILVSSPLWRPDFSMI